MLKAIVFDFDGVIVDSEPLHYRAFVEIARGFGLDFTYEQYVRDYIGFDDRDAIGAMLQEATGTADAQRIRELCAVKCRRFEAIAERGVRPYPGVLELIQEAAAAMPLAIASGATGHDIDLICQQLGLAGRFTAIVSADDVSHSKPAPQTYTKAVRDLSRRCTDLALEAGDCIAIEDTSAGIKSARVAGLWALGVSNTMGAGALSEAHHVVASLNGLNLETLRRWHDES